MLKDTEALLELVSDWSKIKAGGCDALSVRENGKSALVKSGGDGAKIVPKENGAGLDVWIAPGAKGVKVAIPACVTLGGVDDLAYNDFHVGEGAEATIIAGCGVHVEPGEAARHSGIHRFFVGKGASVKYVEKHVGTGDPHTEKRIDPVTDITLSEDALLDMETTQIGGVDKTGRVTRAKLAAGARLNVRERLLTEHEQTASTKFEVSLDGDGSAVDIVSRSVARDSSFQEYFSVISGNAKCAGHSECDALISGKGRVNASPALYAANEDASLVHEAAVGKIAGEQIMKLMTLGLDEEEAERRIIEGFLS